MLCDQSLLWRRQSIFWEFCQFCQDFCLRNGFVEIFACWYPEQNDVGRTWHKRLKSCCLQDCGWIELRTQTSGTPASIGYIFDYLPSTLTLIQARSLLSRGKNLVGYVIVVYFGLLPWNLIQAIVLWLTRWSMDICLAECVLFPFIGIDCTRTFLHIFRKTPVMKDLLGAFIKLFRIFWSYVIFVCSIIIN